MPSPRPNPLLVDKRPSHRSVKFNGFYLNLAALGRMQHIDSTYLSRIFSGKRTPTLPMALKIASALSMGLEEFLGALQNRVDELENEDNKVLAEHAARKAKEADDDRQALAHGTITEPRFKSLT